MATQDIYNYRKGNDHLVTGGQPTEEQLRDAAAEGFEAVINLATEQPGRSLEDEAGLVNSLGMAYYPIPVVWDHPTSEDFHRFEAVFSRLMETKTLLHCAANFRATAFYSLYAIKHLGWSEEQAETFRQTVWQGSDYPIWEQFIRDVKAQGLVKRAE
jgi:protein tyrosine phosphatase (PTP) superfamily phosphohydrolase (DUF442 family)